MIYFQRHIRYTGLALCLCCIALSGAQVGFVDNEIPSGTIDGVNRSFLISERPVPSSSLIVRINGLHLMLNLDYTLVGNVIVFQTGFAPALGSVLVCSYRVDHAVPYSVSEG